MRSKEWHPNRRLNRCCQKWGWRLGNGISGKCSRAEWQVYRRWLMKRGGMLYISTLRLSEIRWNSSRKLRWWWLLKKLCFTRVTSWERSWFNYAKRWCTASVRMETGARGDEQRQVQLKVVASHGHTVTSTEKNSNGDRWPTFVKPLWAGQRWSAVPISEGLL